VPENTAEGFIERLAYYSDKVSDSVLFGGKTVEGNFILATSASIDMRTLKEVRKMISDRIKEMKDEASE